MPGPFRKQVQGSQLGRIGVSDDSPDGYMERNRGDLRPFAWWFGFVLDIACKRAQIRPEGFVE